MPISLKTERYKCEGAVLYTNSTGSTITAGTPVVVGGRICIPLRDIPNGATDELPDEGRFRCVKKAETWAAGDRVGWASTADPAVGTAGSGAWTKDSTLWDSGYPAGGIAEQAAASGDEFGYLLLNEFKDTLQINGIAGGYKLARGQATTATASDTIATGLASVVAVVASLDSDPVDDPEWVTASIGDQAGTPVAGSFLLKTWKNTGGTDPTPAAATTFSKKVNWLAIGT